MKEYTVSEIGKFLANELSASEREAFVLHMQDDPVLRKEVEDYQRIWNVADTSIPGSWDTQRALEKMSFDRQIPSSAKRISLRKWLIPAAAAVLVLLSLPFIFNTNKPVTYTGQGLADGLLILDDGSKVHLQPNATLTVLPFKNNKRHVSLQGEAFFEVLPDKTRPFTIETKDALTEVVGTSFNIKQDFPGTTIFVHTGKVIFKSIENDDSIVALVAGEAAIANSEKVVPILNPSPNTIAWHTRQLQFKSVPLQSAVKDIADFFNKKITVEESSVQHCRITIPRPFTEPEIMSVLKSVAASIQATVIVNGDSYIIRGGNCD